MRRPELPPAGMDSAQRRVVLGGKRGRLPGPMRARLHSPEFGDRNQRLGELLPEET